MKQSEARGPVQLTPQFKSRRHSFFVMATLYAMPIAACDTNKDQEPIPSSEKSSLNSEDSQDSSKTDNSSKDSQAEKTSSSPTDTEETEDPDPPEEESSSGDNSDEESESTTGDFKNVGKCGLLGEAMVSEDAYEGKVEYYMIADKGDGEDLCLVRFDARSVGTPDVECPRCEWTFMVEFSNPEVVTNTDNLCANSQRQLDEEAIAALDGSRRGYGQIPEFGGHEDTLMELNSMGEWRDVARTTWEPDTGEFAFNNSHGFCKY